VGGIRLAFFTADVRRLTQINADVIVTFFMGGIRLAFFTADVRKLTQINADVIVTFFMGAYVWLFPADVFAK